MVLMVLVHFAFVSIYSPSLKDIGATVLELSGAVAPGVRTTDGRSIVPLLKAAGHPPNGWRNGLLIEHMGENNQWMGICHWVFNATGCPNTHEVQYIIDGPQNTWSMLRVANATHDFAYAEYRPDGTNPSRMLTNWTELYNLTADFYQGINLAGTTPLYVLEAYRSELWAVAACALDSCP